MGSTKTGRRRTKFKVTRRIDVVIVIVLFINVRLGLLGDLNTVGATRFSGRVRMSSKLYDLFLMRRKRKIGMTFRRLRLIGTRK